MTLPKHRQLLTVLAFLALGLGYAWVTSRIDDTSQVEVGVTSHTPDAVTAPPGVSRADIIIPTMHIRSTNQPAESPLPVRLVGRIVDMEGKGLASIKIWLRSLRSTNRRFILRRALTDTKGGFVLDDLDPYNSYLLFTEAAAEYPGYRLDGFTLDSLPTPFEIRLSRLDLVDVEGTVVDAEHAPIAGFTLTIDSLDSEYPSRTVTSDLSGYFRLEDFPAGELKIYTGTPEYFGILGLRARVDEYRNLTLVIDRGRYRLAGRILDKRGFPIVPARITLSSVIADNEYRSHAYRTSLTDASGSFEFTGLSGVTHTLGVYANGYKPHVESHVFQNFSDRLEIRLQR